MVIYNRTIYGKIYNKLFYELGDTPPRPMGEKRSRPSNRSEDAPSSFEQFYTILHKEIHSKRGTTTYKFTIGCATIKYFHVLGKTLSDRRSRAMPSLGVVKGAPSFTIQNTIQTASNVQGNYTSKTINWLYKNGIHEQNIPWGQLEPSGKACPSKEHQWRKDGKLPRAGLCFITITTQQVPSLGKAIKAGHLRHGGLSLAVALRTQGAIRSRVMVWFSWATAGVRSCANAIPRTPKTVFFVLSRPLVPALKVNGLSGPHFYSALSSRDAKHVPTRHWSPRGWRPPRGNLAVVINASAWAMGLSPGKGQKLLNNLTKHLWGYKLVTIKDFNN